MLYSFENNDIGPGSWQPADRLCRSRTVAALHIFLLSGVNNA